MSILALDIILKLDFRIVVLLLVLCFSFLPTLPVSAKSEV